MTSEVSASIKIAQLMCSRLCHDLVSPVGAVNAAVELLGDEDDDGNTGETDNEVLRLLARSASEASSRLAFFRAAFGDGGGPDVKIRCDDLAKLAQGAIGGGKISVQWLADGVDSLPNLAGQLVLILALTASEALPRGGIVSVRIQRMDEGLGIACSAEGPGASLKESISSVLSGSGSPDQLSARDVTALYGYLLAMSVDTSIETSSDEGAIMLAILLP